MVPVSRLPDLCLLALFRQMTLQDKIEARKVCRRWADLVPEANIKRRELILLLGRDSIREFERRIDWALFDKCQSLKLLLKADGSKMHPTQRLTNWNSLHLDWLNEASTEEIASTFTQTKKLQVTVLRDSQSTMDSLAHLLELWSHQLIDLQFFENSWNVDNQAITRLFAAINAQSALKKLHLHLENRLPVPDLSIVSQLEELRFVSYHSDPKEFAQWLQQYGEGNRDLARIEYGTSFSQDFEPFKALSEHLRLCFTRLTFYLFDDLAALCGQFRGVTSLTLSPVDITPRHLFTHLATLRQLIHINLTIASFPVDDLEHHLLLPQVKSVLALELTLFNKTPFHQELAKLKLPWTLPNVEVILFVLAIFSCTECHINNFRQRSEQAKSCLCKLFAPLKRDCTKLRLIEHNQKQVYGTAEELLAE